MERKDWQFAIPTTLGVWLFLIFTAPGIPLVWDEVEYLLRAEHITSWFDLVLAAANPEALVESFSESTIKDRWMFISYSEGHPAWFAVPIALSQAMFSGLLSPLTAARIGPITVFSLACGFVSVRLKKDYGTTAAVIGPVALATFPRIFSHSHFATLDGQLTAWWLMLWAVGASLKRDTRTMICVGVLAGLTSATKFTGWLAWGPLALSRLFKRESTEWRWILALIPIGLFTFWVVNPPLWHSPVDELMTHFQLHLGRSTTNNNIPNIFFGKTYDLQHSLPWYNSLAWLALTTPLPTLLLGLAGFSHCLRQALASQSTTLKVRAAQATSVALLLHWSTLMVARALPGVPPHDGIRLFLPSFGFWCLFAGIGAQRVWDCRPALTSSWHRRIIRTTLVAALIGTSINLARYYPQTLSHYAMFVGGLRGADRLGMEPTYWWDALDTDALTWLNTNTPPNSSVAFSRISAQNLSQLQEWGRLQIDVTSPDEGNFQWYVLQNRPGLFSPVDKALHSRAEPVYVNYAGRHEQGVPPDLQVPLLMIFSSAQYERALVESQTGQ